MNKDLLLSVALTAAVGGFVASLDVLAVPVRQNATGICQGALPAFDTQIRKRPLAVRNEGTQGAFVSCSLSGEEDVAHDFAQFVFTNSTGAEATVGCTVVTGRAVFDTMYYPRSVDIPAGGTHSIAISFDNATDMANLVNSSCLLPPGVQLDYIRIDSVDAP